MDRGELVPDRLVVDLVARHLSGPEPLPGFVLDGFPRTLAQAKTAYDWGREHDRTFHAVDLARRPGGRARAPAAGARAGAPGAPTTPRTTIRNRLAVYADEHPAPARLLPRSRRAARARRHRRGGRGHADVSATRSTRSSYPAEHAVLLAELAETSRAGRGHRGPLDEDRAARRPARRLEPDEVVPAVALLAGEARQGRIGVGWATVARSTSRRRPRRSSPCSTSTPRSTTSWRSPARGRSGARRARLTALFARATDAEAELIRRLLLGDLRQGALEGIMADAVGRGGGASRRRRCAGPRCSRATSPPWPPSRSPRARPGWTRSACRCSGRCCRCWPRPRPTSPRRSPPAGCRRSSGSSTAPASRSTGPGPRCASSPATSTTSPTGWRGWPRSSASLPATALILDGEVIGARLDERPELFQSTMSRFGRQVGEAAPMPRKTHRRRHRAARVVLRLPPRRRSRPDRPAARRAAGGARAGRGAVAHPRDRHRRPRRGRRRARRGAGRRATRA